MTTLLYTDIVNRLKGEYSGSSWYGENFFTVHAGRSILNSGFIGSANVVSLTCLDTIVHEAPGCVAAPLVHLIAKNAIRLGMEGQGDEPVPVRIYAPRQLSITTKHLFVGDLRFIVEPKQGFVACKKLTLSKSTEEDPDYFEIVKSWAINDDMEIEVTSTASPKAESKKNSK